MSDPKAVNLDTEPAELGLDAPALAQRVLEILGANDPGRAVTLIGGLCDAVVEANPDRKAKRDAAREAASAPKRSPEPEQRAPAPAPAPAPAVPRTPKSR